MAEEKRLQNERTAADVIVAALRDHGVDTVFGLPGVQTYALFDALHRNQDAIRTIGARHEQGVAYMAFGYAQSTGKLGVFCCVPGPGVLNSSAAMCTAQGMGASVLCLTGEVPRTFMGKGYRHLHELDDQLGILKRVVKSAQHVALPDQVHEVMQQAIFEAMSAPRGVAAVSMCWDELGAGVVDQAERAVIPTPAFEMDSQLLEAGMQLIKDARHPLIFVGGGAIEAAEQVVKFAEALQIPVVSFRAGRGVIPEDHELSVSITAATHLWLETDLIIGIGSRLEVPFMRWSNPAKARTSWPNVKLLRIDVDEQELQRLDADVAIVGDSREVLELLNAEIQKQSLQAQASTSRLRAAKEQAARAIQEIQPQMSYLEVIRKHLPRDGYFVDELCQVGYAAYFGFPVYEPRTFITAGFQGTLGYGYATALGVKAAHPEKVVISISGDGGFLFGANELATAVQYQLNVIALVFNNSAYGNVNRDQKTIFDNRTIASELQNPDFVALAESYGAIGYRVDSANKLDAILAEAIALDKPVVIEVLIEPGSEPRPWHLISAPDLQKSE